MKKFLKNTSLFSLASFIIIIIIVSIPWHLIKSKSNFKLIENKSIIVLGHSHAECAFNDSLILDLKNLAESGASYFYTYQKIKKIIPDNPHIKTVFIEFSNDQINVKMNEWIWGYEKMNHYLPKYSPFMDKEDFLILFNNNSTDFMTCMSVATKKNFLRIIKSDYDYTDELGGFKWLDKNQLEIDIDKNKKIDLDISFVNLNYLRKIIDYCRDNNVVVFLTRSPQHKEYPYLRIENDFHNIRLQKFSDVEFLDFNDFPMPNDYFADTGHLNYKGANIFSSAISKLFEDDLLKANNKQELINEFIMNY